MPNRTKQLFLSHPWHGIPLGDRCPEIVNAFIEMVPTDVVKYEVDKATGHLRIDRPQKYSSQCPALYGFVPQTFCGSGVGALCSARTGTAGIVGDLDPLDICVLSEKPITHGNILLLARPIGGLRLIDNNSADDKIIAVLNDDGIFGKWGDIAECPVNLLERLRHYFLSYKDMPGESKRDVKIAEIYGAKEAKEVIVVSAEDYQKEYGG